MALKKNSCLFCCSCPSFSSFTLPCPSHLPAPGSHGACPHRRPGPRVSHTRPLANPSPVFPHSRPAPFPLAAASLSCGFFIRGTSFAAQRVSGAVARPGGGSDPSPPAASVAAAGGGGGGGWLCPRDGAPSVPSVHFFYNSSGGRAWGCPSPGKQESRTPRDAGRRGAWRCLSTGDQTHAVGLPTPGEGCSAVRRQEAGAGAPSGWAWKTVCGAREDRHERPGIVPSIHMKRPRGSPGAPGPCTEGLRPTMLPGAAEGPAPSRKPSGRRRQTEPCRVACAGQALLWPQLAPSTSSKGQSNSEPLLSSAVKKQVFLERQRTPPKELRAALLWAARQGPARSKRHLPGSGRSPGSLWSDGGADVSGPLFSKLLSQGGSLVAGLLRPAQLVKALTEPGLPPPPRRPLHPPPALRCQEARECVETKRTRAKSSRSCPSEERGWGCPGEGTAGLPRANLLKTHCAQAPDWWPRQALLEPPGPSLALSVIPAKLV